MLESPSVSTTSGSPSFSKYKNVPDPNFSTTKTLLSQLASASWLINRCSGLIPMCILSPTDALESVLLTNNFEDPSKSTSVELLNST